jgi:RNA polymerase sigma-70 factor (ECF subfamily)
VNLPEIVEEHGRLVLKTAYRILKNWEDAQDAAQEVFLRIHRSDAGFDESRELGPWLYRITVNVALDQYRRKRPNVAIEGGFEAEDANPGPEESALLEQQRGILHAAIEQLPRQQRAAILLREIEGLSTDEVARQLGSTAATVRSQVSLGKARLRRILLASAALGAIVVMSVLGVRTWLRVSAIEWPPLMSPVAQLPPAPVDPALDPPPSRSGRAPRPRQQPVVSGPTSPVQAAPAGVIRLVTADETVVIYWLTDDPQPRKGEEE